MKELPEIEKPIPTPNRTIMPKNKPNAFAKVVRIVIKNVAYYLILGGVFNYMIEYKSFASSEFWIKIIIFTILINFHKQIDTWTNK